MKISESQKALIRQYAKDEIAYNKLLVLFMETLNSSQQHHNKGSATLPSIEEKLRQSETHHRILLDAIPDLIFHMDSNGNYLNYHANHEDLYLPGDKILSKNVLEVLPTHIAKPVLQNIRKALKTEQMQSFDYHLDIPQQGTRYYEARIVPSGHDEIIAIVRDITERKQIENQLRQSEARNRALLEAIPDLIFRFNREGDVLDYHAHEKDLYDQSGNLLSRNVKDSLSPEFAEQTLGYIHKTLDTGEMQIHEYTLDMPDGPRDFEARMVPSADDEVISIVRDITQHKQAQTRELELKLEKERRHVLAAFIQNASHEFRTPLTILSSGIYLMTRTDDIAKREVRAKALEEQIKRLTRLVDMLLHMVTLDQKQQLSSKRINIHNIIKEACAEITNQHKDTHQLILKIQPDLPSTYGDEECLYHAFKHILDNAHRFTPPDGTITVTAENSNDHIQIAICDTGIGISKDHLPHIFKTFWRNDIVHSSPGLGLGLPIAKRIFELHGGTISVKSQLNEGSCFTIVLHAAGTG